MMERRDQPEESNILEKTVEEPGKNTELLDKKRAVLAGMKNFIEREIKGNEAGKIMEKIEASLDKITRETSYKLDFLLEDLEEIRNLRDSIGKVEKEINDFRGKYGGNKFESRKATLMLVKKNSGLRGLLFRNLFRKRTPQEQEVKHILEEDYNIKAKDISSELKRMEQEMKFFTDAQQQKTKIEKELFLLKESLFRNFDALVDLTKRMRAISYLETMRTMRESGAKLADKDKNESQMLVTGTTPEVKISSKPTKEETKKFFDDQIIAQEKIHFEDSPEPSIEQSDEVERLSVSESTETSDSNLRPEAVRIRDKIYDILYEFFSGKINFEMVRNKTMTILIKVGLSSVEKNKIREFIENKVNNIFVSSSLEPNLRKQAQNLLDFFKEKLR